MQKRTLSSDEGPLTIPYSGYARIRGNLWGWEPVLSTSPLIVDSIDDGKRAELQELAKDEYSSLIKSNMLSSQFRILYYLEVKKEEVKENILFASPLDITAIEKFPVILASYLERQEGEVTFSTDRIYPMARYGAGALVSFAEDKIGLYNISDLPQEAQDRQKLIDQTLDSLEANMEDVDVSTSLFDKNAEVQAMIQQLAKDYYQYHQLLQEQDKKKRTRRKPTPIEAKGNDFISIRSDVLGWKILYALRNRDEYIKYKEQNTALYRHEFDVTLRDKGHSQKEQAQLMITIEPQKDEGWETVLAALNTLGDGCMDTFTALMAIAIERNGVDKMRMPFEISPDDILEICKKEKSNRSYKAVQKAEIVAHLKTLSQAHIIATIPTVITRKRRGKDVTEKTIIKAEGAILDLLSFKIGEYSTITGEEIWEKREVSIGAWAEMIPGINASTAMMLRQVLAYKAKNQRYQKRIGRYLTLMFRFNARRGGSFPNDISMGALLAGAGIKPPREVGDFKEAIENALKDLKQDDVIGDYWRVIEETPEAIEIDRKVTERAKGWFDYYLKQMWNFKPPVAIQKQYKNLLKKPPEKDVNGN